MEEIFKDKDLLKELGLEELPSIVKVGLTPIANPSFKDIKTQHWAYNTIIEAAEKGFVAGMPDGNFKRDEDKDRVFGHGIISIQR